MAGEKAPVQHPDPGRANAVEPAAYAIAGMAAMSIYGIDGARGAGVS